MEGKTRVEKKEKGRAMIGWEAKRKKENMCIEICDEPLVVSSQ